ncbi:MAG: hypothetical protein L6Q98_22245 [Anaerolineae bacterium]|nr:hypothetical protein [Anaerolineae bacterium]NUQ04881.1 hypothetical protein [Anaerolineae bacterium]
MSKKSTPKPPTVITLTLPENEDATLGGTLLVQRGDLARLHQFTYTRIADLSEIIADALIAFAAVEADPPIIPEAPPPKPQPTKKVAVPTPSAEPTVDVPLKKGTKAVKISHLKIVGGETDAAAYRQAVLLAGKLIDGKLWDGESPIRIDDVYMLAKKMKHLSERELSLFTLQDFVQVGTLEPDDAPEETADEPDVFDEVDEDSAALTIAPPRKTPISANGHHNGASDQTALL